MRFSERFCGTQNLFYSRASVRTLLMAWDTAGMASKISVTMTSGTM